MRKIILAISIALITFGSAMADDSSGADFDWEMYRNLPVQERGRRKPLDTVARESVQQMFHSSGVADPETGRYLAPMALYLTMLFDWHGWAHPLPPEPPEGGTLIDAYFQSHEADKWDRAAMFPVDSDELRKALNMAPGEICLSAMTLKDATVLDPRFGQTLPLLEWVDMLARIDRKQLSKMEKKGLALGDGFATYLKHRMGIGLEILPIQGSRHEEWYSLALIVRSELNDENDPRGELRNVQKLFQMILATYHKRSPVDFQKSSADFLTEVRRLGPTLGEYPAQKDIDLETAYNCFTPFRWAWRLSLAAFFIASAGKFICRKTFYVAALTAFAAGILLAILGFALRIEISDRPPITNMYESVLSVGLGIALMGLACELAARKGFYLLEASAATALVLFLADSFPTVLDPSIHPLNAVLRDNFLLWTHVSVIMLSYAALARACLLADIRLGCVFVSRPSRDLVMELEKTTLLMLRIGTFLLTAGTLLGALWGDYAWGRFWGWDPKEVWALISLLFVLIILHARHVGWIGDFGTAVWSVFTFIAILVTWYFVNYYSAGLHSYGSGQSGEMIYINATLTIQLLYLFAAGLKRVYDNTAEKAP